MALMILFILYWGMAFHSMMIAFSNIAKVLWGAVQDFHRMTTIGPSVCWKPE
jgi:hypothetical protein